MRSVIILAGGRSTRFGRDKGLVCLGGRALIERAHESAREVAREVVVAVSSRRQREAYSRLVNKCTFVVDEQRRMGPLSGLRSALRIVKARKVAVVACDMPFLSERILNLLFELCVKQNAVIPRWPNGYIEPLHSVYDSAGCLTATSAALEQGCGNLRGMICKLQNILHVSTEVIRAIQPQLATFTNINTPGDLAKARRILVTDALRHSK